MKRKKYTQVQRIALAEKIISQLFIAYEKLNLRIEKIETIIKKQDNE